MRNFRDATLTIILLVILYYLHYYGMKQHWYLYFPYFDLITHFLGGVCLALSAFYILNSSRYIIPLTLLAGIAWEVFEIMFDITGWTVFSPAYNFDTTIDIIMDTLGAVLVWGIIKFKKPASIQDQQ